MLKCAIVGASGYVGAELVSLVAAHPEARLVSIHSESNAGERWERLYPARRHVWSGTLAPFEPAALSALDVVFLALPHGASARAAALLDGRVGRIIDLSGDLRLRDAAHYERWYGTTHHELGHIYYYISYTNPNVPLLLRGPDEERLRMDMLGSLMVPTSSGRSVPLTQIATLDYGFEEGIIWHRDRQPTMTVRADIYDGTQPATVTAQISPTLDALRAQLPYGYSIDVGGSVEDSGRGQRSIVAGMPLFVFVVFTLLMLQLRSFSRSFMVLLTAPLGLIGVTLFLLVFRVPFGFVAMLGTIALAGMIMRNSVILVDQIEHDIGAGAQPWEAIVEATVRRFRPIVLTALAAILAMIPLSRSAFFGPMAVAIMGGLTVATFLTLLFLPALYAAWFKVKAPQAA